MPSNYSYISYDIFEKIKSEVNFLFIATNNIEHKTIIEKIENDTKPETVKTFVDNKGVTFFLGKFGSQKIAYAKISEMGSTGASGSNSFVQHAIMTINPLAVIMLGVAASMDDSFSIGDVVVAKEVVTYQDYKAKDNKIIFRSKHYYSDYGILYKLFDVITDEQFDTSHLSPNEAHDAKRIHKSMVLSGGVLLDSQDLRKDLKEIFPEAGALEMEGQGFAAASIGEGVHNWILIKGICDKGHDKSTEKDANQKYAMLQAIKLCNEVFSEPKNFSFSSRPSKYKSIFISGSHIVEADAVEQEFLNKKLTDKYHKCKDANQFAYELAKKLNSNDNDYRIVTGYGAEIGQAIVSGVFSNIIIKDDELNENIACFPFPRMKEVSYGNYTFDELKVKYREKMISETKLFICIFGAKVERGEPVFADGVEKEFKTSIRNGSFIIPVGATGFISKQIWNEVRGNLDKFYPIRDSPSAERKKIREEAVDSLNIDTDFSDEKQRELLINNIIAFLSEPWNKI